MRTERIIEKESVWLWETEKNEKESKKLIETRPSWVKISSNFFLHISQKAESLSFEKMTLFFFKYFSLKKCFLSRILFLSCLSMLFRRSVWLISFVAHSQSVLQSRLSIRDLFIPFQSFSVLLISILLCIPYCSSRNRIISNFFEFSVSLKQEAIMIIKLFWVISLRQKSVDL